MGVWYCTREDVKQTLDSRESARNHALIDRCIEAGSRSIDGHQPGGGLLHRRFYPETATRYFDWPNHQYSRPWRLWLDANELISVSSLVAGGVTIASTDYFLKCGSGYEGPPYTHIEIDLDSSAAFAAGNTHQRAIAITGVFGHSNDTTPAGTLAEALDASETGVDVSNSAAIGVGNIIIIDSERMIVTEKSMLTTGQTVQTTALTAADNNVTVNVTDGTTFNVGETILIDSERMLVVDIAGNALTVRRAFDGSVLAAHNTGTTIYAPRTLTVTRGALGSTAATHSTSTTIYRHVVPGPVRELCIAEAITEMKQGSSGYARTAGSGDAERLVGGRGLADIREAAYLNYGRKARISAI